jgi:hypothetical protein
MELGMLLINEDMLKQMLPFFISKINMIKLLKGIKKKYKNKSFV